MLLGAAIGWIAVGLAIYLPDRPPNLRGGCCQPLASRGSYDLLVTFFPILPITVPLAAKTVRSFAGETNMDTPMLGIYQNGELLPTRRVLCKGASCTRWRAVPQENGTLVVEAPGYNPDYRPSARMSYIYYTGESGLHQRAALDHYHEKRR